MQINLLYNSLLFQQSSLQSMSSKQTGLVKPNVGDERNSALDAIAQDIIEKTVTSGSSSVYLTNTLAQGETGLLQEIMSLRDERNQKISELVASGIEPTKAKYIVSSKEGGKGIAALKEHKNREAGEVIENSTKEIEEEQASEYSEEVVEEVIIKGSKINPSSGEEIREVKVVKKIRTKAAHLSSSDTKLEKVSTPKGQKIDIKV